MTWTDLNVELLKKLWMEGLSASQIAAEIGCGVTRNAVIGKIHRLKLPAIRRNTSPTRASTRKRVPRTSNGSSVGRRTRRTTKSGKGESSGESKAETTATELTEESITYEGFTLEPSPNERRVGILELTKDTCKWPIGDPLGGKEDFYFCGGGTSDKKIGTKRNPRKTPYCDFHERRARISIRKGI